MSYLFKGQDPVPRDTTIAIEQHHYQQQQAVGYQLWGLMLHRAPCVTD